MGVKYGHFSPKLRQSQKVRHLKFKLTYTVDDTAERFQRNGHFSITFIDSFPPIIIGCYLLKKAVQ